MNIKSILSSKSLAIHSLPIENLKMLPTDRRRELLSIFHQYSKDYTLPKTTVTPMNVLYLHMGNVVRGSDKIDYPYVDQKSGKTTAHTLYIKNNTGTAAGKLTVDNLAQVLIDTYQSALDGRGVGRAMGQISLG